MKLRGRITRSLQEDMQAELHELPALMGSAPPANAPSTGTGVVVCLMA
jgi:hypothetical protein